MNLNINTKTAIILGSLAVAVILFVAIFQGISTGKAIAQSQAIVKSAENITAALNYFYSDQNRYPNALEFGEQNVMLNYLNTFPLPEFTSSACTQSFSYKKNSATSVVLSFCLPRTFEQYQQGWNNVVLNK